jgi:hypothetical protein
VTRGLQTHAGRHLGNGHGGVLWEDLYTFQPTCQDSLVGGDPGRLPKSEGEMGRPAFFPTVQSEA